MLNRYVDILNFIKVWFVDLNVSWYVICSKKLVWNIKIVMNLSMKISGDGFMWKFKFFNNVVC